jgi:hypothetical protein
MGCVGGHGGRHGAGTRGRCDGLDDAGVRVFEPCRNEITVPIGGHHHHRATIAQGTSRRREFKLTGGSTLSDYEAVSVEGAFGVSRQPAQRPGDLTPLRFAACGVDESHTKTDASSRRGASSRR